MEVKKGMYFSFDALIALSLLSLAFVTILGGNHGASEQLSVQRQTVEQADAAAESALQVSMRQNLEDALNSSQLSYYQSNTALSAEDRKKPVMDAIAMLWASNETAAAQNLTKLFFNDVLPDRYDYQISMEESGRDILYNTTNTTGDAKIVSRASRMVSGVSRDRPTSGYIARATLSEATKEEKQTVFMGGYVGDGNVTLNVTLPDLDTVQNVTLEGDFSGPFNVSLNDQPAGNYSPSGGNLSADVFHICSQDTNTAYCEALKSGDNDVHLDFTGENKSIGGGFLQIRYNRTTGLDIQGEEYKTKRHRMPGINGIINLYSGFYPPGDLHGLNAKVHYAADRGELTFGIGNATIYKEFVEGGDTLTFNNTTISDKLNASNLTYSSISRSTVPFHVGMTRESLAAGEAGAIDAVAATDLSGSMSSQCNSGGGSKCKLNEAKDATKDFLDLVLTTPDGRVGLTGFNDFIKSYMALSQNGTKLKNEVDSYDGNGGTCVGCGVLRSLNTLIQDKRKDTVLPSRSQWNYVTGATVDDSWTSTSFDDSSWSTGTAPIGYGGKSYTDAGDADVYRFRKTFNFSHEEFYQPYLSLRHTGNATVYLNGEQIHASQHNLTGTYWDTNIGKWAEYSGLWHKTENKSASGDSSWYFGQEEVYTYATGQYETGNLTTPSIDLSPVTNPTLTFTDWLETNKNKDIAYVEINDGTGWQELNSYRTSSKSWTDKSFDLSSYTDDTVRIRFRFEPQKARGKNDDYEGWYVDNVKVGGFRSTVLNRSLLNGTGNVLAVELQANNQPYVNGSHNRTSFTGTFVNTTATGNGVELDSATSGHYLSSPIDAGQITEWTANMTYTTEPSGTGISLRYGTNTTGAWTYYDTFDAVPNGRYLRFNASLSSDTETETPTLHSVLTNYSSYGTSFDLKMTGDKVRTPSMLVLSDGLSNAETQMENVSDQDNDGDVDATDHAIEAGCRSQNKYRVDVYAVAFGDNADPEELNQTAQCGGGKFYIASLGDLEDVYRQIARDIIEASFDGQEITVEEGGINQTLYPDSFIEMNYSTRDTAEFGRFELTQQSDRLGGNVSSPKNGSFTVPPDVGVSDTKVTSYSSKYWTDRLQVLNDTGSYEHIYKLWAYNERYSEIGDPFLVHIPDRYVSTGQNNFSIDTALNQSAPRGGSPDNQVFYTLSVKGSVGYGDAYTKSEGGEYTFDTVHGETTIAVGNSTDDWDTSNDAIDDATKRLIQQLDVDNDGVVDVKLDGDDVSISTQNTGGIQWLWGPATVSLEVWRK